MERKDGRKTGGIQLQPNDSQVNSVVPWTRYCDADDWMLSNIFHLFFDQTINQMSL